MVWTSLLLHSLEQGKDLHLPATTKWVWECSGKKGSCHSAGLAFPPARPGLQAGYPQHHVLSVPCPQQLQRQRTKAPTTSPKLNLQQHVAPYGKKTTTCSFQSSQLVRNNNTERRKKNTNHLAPLPFLSLTRSWEAYINCKAWESEQTPSLGNQGQPQENICIYEMCKLCNQQKIKRDKAGTFH